MGGVTGEKVGGQGDRKRVVGCFDGGGVELVVSWGEDAEGGPLVGLRFSEEVADNAAHFGCLRDRG